ncbi:PLP-dependent transferase [Rhodotorula sp. JG-1b]|nr:PLP-dependent transferase [Rhodotorula sp. JG-1b]
MASSSSATNGVPASNGVQKKEEHQFGWAISDKIVPEVNKQDVWSVFSPLAGHVPKDSLNLGQGFMSWAPPQFVQDAHTEALKRVEANHYQLPRGNARLRKAISAYLSPAFRPATGGRDLDPNTEVQVTAGANEGMYAFAAAFIRPGDEVIILEPFFDQYVPQVTFNGGVPVFVPIRAPKGASEHNVPASEWKVDLDELRAAITPRTKMIFFNTPQNPIGKVFSEEELRGIGKVAEEHDLLILSDEVYDCLTFGGKEHVRIAALDDFWKRTVTIGSAGKSFAATGWRVGWAIGPANLIQPLLAAQTRIVFCCNGPAQEAIAVGLEQAQENGFFAQQVQEYDERKNVLLEGLDKLGLPYTVPEGAYFVMVNTSRLEIPSDFEIPDLIKGRARDWVVAWFIAQTAKVVLIPPTDFYSKPHWNLGENWIRVAFCKDPDTLRQATERLLALKPYIRDA